MRSNPHTAAFLLGKESRCGVIDITDAGMIGQGTRDMTQNVLPRFLSRILNAYPLETGFLCVGKESIPKRPCQTTGLPKHRSMIIAVSMTNDGAAEVLST